MGKRQLNTRVTDQAYTLLAKLQKAWGETWQPLSQSEAIEKLIREAAAQVKK